MKADKDIKTIEKEVEQEFCDFLKKTNNKIVCFGKGDESVNIYCKSVDIKYYENKINSLKIFWEKEIIKFLLKCVSRKEVIVDKMSLRIKVVRIFLSPLLKDPSNPGDYYDFRVLMVYYQYFLEN